MLRILSIDGGGIRGIIPSQILITLEKILQSKSGNTNARISDFFDLVAGTNSGGILACAYLVPDVINASRPRYNAAEVASLYLERGPGIYDLPLTHRIRSANGYLDEKYPASGLEEVLKDYFGDVWLSELIRPCLIPAYDIKRRKAHFFTQHNASHAGDDFLARDVARAAGSTPTYFECSFVTSRSQVHYPLIDGSIYANNPALCALAEAKMNFVHTDDSATRPATHDMLVLSLGTGYSRQLYPYEDAKDWGLSEWSKPMIDIMMSGVSETVDFQLKTLFDEKSGNYLRVNPAIPDDLSEETDNVSAENINALKELGIYCAQQQQKDLEKFADKLLAGGDWKKV